MATVPGRAPMTAPPVPRAASARRLSSVKVGYYGLTSLNMLATSYYLNYQFFFLRDRFGFGDRENLAVSALHGLIYTVAAWQGGRFAERRGPFASLYRGFGGLGLCMLAGLGLRGSPLGLMFVLVAYTVVLLLTWPALEALATEDEPSDRVPHMVGLYNATWSGSAAVAYFTGGPLYDWLGPGAVFGVPAVLFFAELALTARLARRSRGAASPGPIEAAVASTPMKAPPQPIAPGTFLMLARVANPLSYVAAYSLFAAMPGLAVRLGLSPTRVGIFCSVWLFGRFAGFVGLWRWTGWHYRFRWLLVAYGLLSVCFVGILTASHLWQIVIAQVGFGGAAALIYYSSLFYAMDVGEARAEHGGLHEAGIGLGVCLGPAVGALGLQLAPGWPAAGAVAVGGLLGLGGVGLMLIWLAKVHRKRRKSPVA